MAENLLDNLVDNAEFYGVDPEVPSPLESSDDNNVVVPELKVTGDIEHIQKTVLDWFDLLKSSTQMGIDVFVTVKENIYELIYGA